MLMNGFEGEVNMNVLVDSGQTAEHPPMRHLDGLAFIDCLDIAFRKRKCDGFFAGQAQDCASTVGLDLDFHRPIAKDYMTHSNFFDKSRFKVYLQRPSAFLPSLMRSRFASSGRQNRA